MKFSIKLIGVYLLNFLLSSILSMLIYVALAWIVRIIPVDEMPVALTAVLSIVWMIFIQMISVTVLINILLKRKKYLLESLDTDNTFEIIKYFFKQDIRNDKNLLLAFCLVFIIDLISISLTAVSDSFGGISGVFFPMFSTQTVPMILFCEGLIFNIIGLILSFCLFLLIYYAVLAILHKKSRNK